MTYITTRTPKTLFPLMSSLFDDFLNSAFSEEQTDANKTMPMDLSERDKDYVIRANVPGIKKENIKVSIHNNELLIEGKQDETKTEKNETVYRYERYKGNYRRLINLPDTTDVEKIEAKLEDGVLTLIIPKKEPTPSKEITIG
ncbi:MAG: Hsp20/alpha crystallin family protein [Candidatus Cloacimonas sp.]|nr:Hsp20/alpha crystallin family protein [Candidatus Cloacimonadota bacterium]